MEDSAGSGLRVCCGYCDRPAVSSTVEVVGCRLRGLELCPAQPKQPIQNAARRGACGERIRGV
jgi:hypothetical protein